MVKFLKAPLNAFFEIKIKYNLDGIKKLLAGQVNLFFACIYFVNQAINFQSV